MIPVRVFHLIHHLRIGGAETLLSELLPCLGEHGFEVAVVCLNDRGPLFYSLQERGIPGYFIGRNPGFDLRAVWRLARLLRVLRPDVLNTHSFSAGFWGRIAGILARTPLVVTTVHTVAGWSQPLKQRLGNRLLLPATDRIVAVSESVRRSLVVQGAPPRMIRVIQNGIRVERYRFTADPVMERMRLGLPSDGSLIGMIGRCSAEKGGADFVRAVALLARRGLGVRGVVVGDGPERGAWQRLAADEGIADRMHWAGEQIHMVPWLSVFSILVCPSLQESFGIAALEAQAAGVPVVATRVDGFLEVLRDGESALLTDPGNPSSLAEAIHELLTSEKLAFALSAAGRRNAASFSIERTAAQYAAMYRELVTESRPQ